MVSQPVIASGAGNASGTAHGIAHGTAHGTVHGDAINDNTRLRPGTGEPVDPLDETHAASPASPASGRDSVRDSVTTGGRARAASNVSSLLRTSIRMLESETPLGFVAATATAASKAPALSDVRTGSYGVNGWNDVRQQADFERRMGTAAPPAEHDGPAAHERRRRLSRAASHTLPSGLGPPITPVAEEGGTRAHTAGPAPPSPSGVPAEHVRPVDGETRQLDSTANRAAVPHHLIHYTDGYTPPPHLPWTTSAAIYASAFWNFFTTLKGFIITVYFLNVVAWGGMLFLILCKAAPAMCHPSCSDPNSASKIWTEIDSQVVNALFCVTGLGLIPWRGRDLYFLLLFRLRRNTAAIRRLAGYHNDWFRLRGSDLLDCPDQNGQLPPTDETNPAVPLPVSKTPPPPLTGVRAPPTRYWKLDLVIWMNIWNSIFQIALASVMWAFNRHNRPSWTTAAFISGAFGCAIAGGVLMFVEGRKIKRVEGVALSKEARQALIQQDLEKNAAAVVAKQATASK